MQRALCVALAGLGVIWAGQAYAQTSPLVGAWSCDAYSSRSDGGIDQTIQSNPVFHADGSFSDDATLELLFGDRVGNFRFETNGAWQLDNDGYLQYESAKVRVIDGSVDGQPIDTAGLTERLSGALTPGGFRVRFENDAMMMEWDEQSVPCHQRATEALG